MPKQSFSSFILSDTKAHSQHLLLLLLQSLEDSYVSSGLIKSADQNTSLKSLYNLLYSSKPFSFLMHKARLDMVDNLPCKVTLRFPITHRVRLFKLCILSVLHSNHEVFQAFANSGYLKNINKRLISIFTLFHLCLRSSHQIVRSAVGMDPETKWPNPLFFIKPCKANKEDSVFPEKTDESGLFNRRKRQWASHPRLNQDGEYSYNNWESFTLLFRKLSPFYPILCSTYNHLLSLKYPGRTWVHKDSFVFPLDLSCIRNDITTFNYIVTTYPHAIKLSPISFYLTTSCKVGLKLFYYNNEIPESSLHYHAMKGNYEMVALILEVEKRLNKKDKYGETPTMLSAKNNNFHTFTLLIEKNSDSGIPEGSFGGKGGLSYRTAIMDKLEKETDTSEWGDQTMANVKKLLSSEDNDAFFLDTKSTKDVLKNLNWMRRHVWNEKDMGTFFHISNTEKAKRFMRKLGSGMKQHNFNRDYSLLCVLKGIYKNKDVKAHNPMEYLFDAFGDLINF